MCLKQRALLLSALVAGIATHSNALPGVHARPAPAEWRYITDVEGRRVRLVGPRFLPDPRRRMSFPGRNDGRMP